MGECESCLGTEKEIIIQSEIKKDDEVKEQSR